MWDSAQQSEYHNDKNSFLDGEGFETLGYQVPITPVRCRLCGVVCLIEKAHAAFRIETNE